MRQVASGLDFRGRQQGLDRTLLPDLPTVPVRRVEAVATMMIMGDSSCSLTVEEQKLDRFTSAQHFTRRGRDPRPSRRPRGARQRYGEPSPTRYEVVWNRTCPLANTRLEIARQVHSWVNGDQMNPRASDRRSLLKAMVHSQTLRRRSCVVAVHTDRKDSSSQCVMGA